VFYPTQDKEKSEIKWAPPKYIDYLFKILINSPRPIKLTIKLPLLILKFVFKIFLHLITKVTFDAKIKA